MQPTLHHSRRSADYIESSALAFASSMWSAGFAVSVRMFALFELLTVGMSRMASIFAGC